MGRGGGGGLIELLRYAYVIRVNQRQDTPLRSKYCGSVDKSGTKHWGILPQVCYDMLRNKKCRLGRAVFLLVRNITRFGC